MNDLLLLPFKILLISIDLLITILTFGWVPVIKKFFSDKPLRSVPVNDSDPSHRVDPRYKGALAKTPRDGVATLYDLAKDSFSRYGSRHCMGTREFKGWKVPGKVKEFGDIHWVTYADVGVKAHKFGAALRAAGLKAAPPTTDLNRCTEPCRIAIFENTCSEWMIAAIGSFTQALTVVTVYATLGIDAVAEAVQDNSIRAIVCNQKDVSRLAEMSSKMPTLTLIIYTNDLVPPNTTFTPPSIKGVKVVSFHDFCESGNTQAYPTNPPTADSCAVVMYTSGSTGKPKGVIITHRQVVSIVAAAEVALTIRRGKDVYLAYLPLAHIMELMAEFVMLTQGCTLCYADPKSLTTTGAYPVGALEQYGPTLMIAVPKIWDVIKKGIEAKVAAGSPIAAFLVKTAFEWRNFALHHGFDTPLFKALVFKKFAKVTGGNLRFGLSGGGALNREVQDFIRTAFGIDFVQGYGLTETNAGLTIQASDDLRGGIAGVPIPSVEIKLEGTPEICDRLGKPYLPTDTEDVEGNPVFGRGEIVARGPSISSGYYMMPEQTKEVYTDDGWFHTGDIGQYMSDGSIRIVDRKKNLVKLKGGEYIAMEKMEMTYGNSSFVDAIHGGICCYGDHDMDRPVALLQLNEAVAMKWAKENGVTGDIETVKKSEELHKAILEDMKKEHAKSDLCHIEKLVGVALLTSPWTPENGCLTAANKLQRREVINQFEKEFLEVKKKGIF